MLSPDLVVPRADHLHQRILMTKQVVKKRNLIDLGHFGYYKHLSDPWKCQLAKDMRSSLMEGIVR